MMGRASDPGRPPALRDVVATAGRGAAMALEAITGREVWIREPRLCRAGEPAAADAPEFEVGVLFTTEGDLGGRVAILFTLRARELAVLSLLGRTREPHDPTEVESAFLELGNILASQAVSAVADAGHGRILLSVPALVAKPGAGAGAAPRGRSGVRAEIELLDRDGELRALLVLAPDA